VKGARRAREGRRAVESCRRAEASLIADVARVAWQAARAACLIRAERIEGDRR